MLALYAERSSCEILQFFTEYDRVRSARFNELQLLRGERIGNVDELLFSVVEFLILQADG